MEQDATWLREDTRATPLDFFLSYAPADESWALWIAVLHPDNEHLIACDDQGLYFLRLVI